MHLIAEFKNTFEPGVVTQAFELSPWDGEAGGSL